ncbi:MAG TPA: UDP-glucose 4-epimerase, partial [Clostridiaceae bacterium]|nr:UDP-glucose 4-epimerase [Clostridiaceae bacterium]
MKKILITGAMGQLGSELTTALRAQYGTDNVIGTDIRRPDESSPLLAGPFKILDVLDGKTMGEIVKNEKVDTIIHLAALLSATAERNPKFAWDINMGGLVNALEV